MAGIIGGQTAVYGNSTVDFQSYAGPGDKALRNDEVRGYQPVSRIGERIVPLQQVVQAAADAPTRPGQKALTLPSAACSFVSCNPWPVACSFANAVAL